MSKKKVVEVDENLVTSPVIENWEEDQLVDVCLTIGNQCESIGGGKYSWTLFVIPSEDDVIESVVVEFPKILKNEKFVFKTTPIEIPRESKRVEAKISLHIKTVNNTHDLEWNIQYDKLDDCFCHILPIDRKLELVKTPCESSDIDPMIFEKIPRRIDYVGPDEWGDYAGNCLKCELRIAFFVPKVSKATPTSFGNFAKRVKNQFYVQTVFSKQINSGILDHFDCIYFPGGMGPRHADALGVEGRIRLYKFIKEGGGFVGICAGAYIATSPTDDYSATWNFGLIKAEILDLEHWNRGSSWNCRIEYSEEGNDCILRSSNRNRVMTYRYANGPLFKIIGAEVTVFARFLSGFSKNGAKKNMQIGSPAIIGQEYYNGRVLACSPHPEKSPLCYSHQVRNLFRWVCKKKPKGPKSKKKKQTRN